jgi:dolichol-phosphate mannosyltransferase
MKIVIIVSTSNEKGNIVRLTQALRLVFLRIDQHNMHILAVDDNSLDGTGDAVRSEMKQYANVHLLTGEKAGLGAAYIRGMDHALSALGADTVFEMYADFSHKPEDVPRMVTALDKGSDFVIGNRYVPGGSIPKEWGFMHRMNPLFGNVVARYLAGMYSIRYCTAGFHMICASILRKIDMQNLKVKCYAFRVARVQPSTVPGL